MDCHLKGSNIYRCIYEEVNPYGARARTGFFVGSVMASGEYYYGLQRISREQDYCMVHVRFGCMEADALKGRVARI